MAFDRSDQTNLDWLHTEVLTDPLTMGYVPDSTQSGVIQPINDPAHPVWSLEPQATVGAQLTPRLLLDAIQAAPESFGTGGQFSDGEREYIRLVVLASVGGFGEGIDTIIEDRRTAISTALTGTGAIKSALDAQLMSISRAAHMFGPGTAISSQDWFTARDNGNIVTVTW